MNKKFLSAILFGALMVTSTGTFVSCKDYDDEIDRIDSELTSIKSAIADLQSKVNAGKYVTNVTANADGILVAFSDGSSTPIAIKGGTTAISIDETTKNWVINGTDTGVCAEGKVEAPTFSIGENGHIYVQYGDAEKEDLGVCTGGIYYVEDGAKMTLHIPNADGEYQDVVLPRAAAISSIEVLGAAGNISWDDVNTTAAEIELGIGQNKQGKAIEFNGKTYAKDALLSVAESEILMQVNPTMADATVYDFYLTDSKGKSIFALGAAEDYKTEDAISRADKTPNKGLYTLPVTIKAGTSYKDAIANNSSIAYAVATKDAFDNEVLSAYELKFTINPNAETSFDCNSYKSVQINKAFDLAELISGDNIVDVKFSFAKDQTANVDAAQAVINGTEITGGVAQKSVYVTVEYLDLNGKVNKVENAIEIYFIASTEAQTMRAEITPTGDPKKDFVTFDLTGLSSWFENTDASVYNYTIKDVKFTAAAKDKNTDTSYAKGAVAVGITKPTAVVTSNAEQNKTGYYKHTVTYTVDAATVIPGTYEAVITYYEEGNFAHTLTLTIVVNDPAVTFDFKPLDLYFTGNDAVAYGTTSKDADVISYNLKGLFGIEKWDNISFSETVPEAYKDADGNTWTAKKWLTSTFGAIEVERANTKYVFGGAYEARAMKATYQPMANKNFAATTYEYSLTIKSAVYEGSLSYVKPTAVKDKDGNITGYTYSEGEAKSISVATANPSTTLKSLEIHGIDKNNEAYHPTDAETNKVQKVTVALEGDNAKQYLETPTGNWSDGWTIKTKANVTIPSDGKTVTCYVRVSVLDQWGMTKTVDVPVTLK